MTSNDPMTYTDFIRTSIDTTIQRMRDSNTTTQRLDLAMTHAALHQHKL